MEYIYVGKIVTTHGLKGEIKIISNIDYSNDIYKVDRTIYIGDKKEAFIIKSYRRHQKYDMLMLDGLDSIEKVLPYKNKNIYFNKEELNPKLFETVIGYDVYNNDIYTGKVIEILKGIKYDMIVVSDKRIIIPYIDPFIINVNHNEKVIKTNYML